MSFTISYNKGFHLPLPNGYKVSIQIGGGNYCDNYDFPIGQERKENYMRSTTAETAIFNPSGEMIIYGDDAVQAYQTPEDVLKTIMFAASLGE